MVLDSRRGIFQGYLGVERYVRRCRGSNSWCNLRKPHRLSDGLPPLSLHAYTLRESMFTAVFPPTSHHALFHTPKIIISHLVHVHVGASRTATMP